MTTARRWVVGTLALTGVAWGCDDGVAPTFDGELDIAPDTLVLVEDDRRAMEIALRDAQGNALDPVGVTWTSRDPSTVRMDGAVLAARAPGVTHVVAELGRARDSVLVEVRFRELEAGEMGIRVQQEEQDGLRIRGELQHQLWIQRPELNGSYLIVEPGDDLRTDPVELDDAAGRDTLLLVAFRDPPRAGRMLLEAGEILELDGTLLATGPNNAALWILDREERRLNVFFAVGTIVLNLRSLQPPARPGLHAGSAVGTVAFEAAGLSIQVSEEGGRGVIEGPLGDETVRIYGQFELPYIHWQFGDGSLAFEGGPAPFAPTRGNGEGEIADEGTLTLSHGAGEGGPGGLRRFASLLTVVEDVFGPGTYALGPGNAEAFDRHLYMGDLAPSMARAVVLEYEPDQTAGPARRVDTAFSTEGVVTITALQPPTELDQGLLTGRLEVELAFEEDGQPTGETTVAVQEFISPLLPNSARRWVGGEFNPPGLAPLFLEPDGTLRLGPAPGGVLAAVSELEPRLCLTPRRRCPVVPARRATAEAQR